MAADQDDPYVIYQLRKPHQRGTQIVPRLVPKSHAPAFSQANYRFNRIRTRATDADDSSLYLPKSLEYPTNWGSFGSESSIWSASSAASAFPNRVSALLRPRRGFPPAAAVAAAAATAKSDATASATATAHTGTASNFRTGVGNTRDDDDATSATSTSSAFASVERTSLLSGNAGEARSLRNFVRFDALHQADLPAPAPLRLASNHAAPRPSRATAFALPPALAEVEREDRIVQAAIDDPAVVVGDDDDPLPEHPARPSRAIETPRRQDSTIREGPGQAKTRERRGMFAWLFSGGERPLRVRRFADAHAAPIMDEAEEAARRAQFVRGAQRARRTSTGGSGFRHSRRGSEGGRRGSSLSGSAKQLWRSLKRSASFTFGSKRARRARKDEEPPMVRGLRDDPIAPSTSFVRRKMAELRESTVRKMAHAREGVIDPAPASPNMKPDRPRGADPRPTLDQLISARPDLHYATTEAVEKLANRINSDLSAGTTLRSSSGPYSEGDRVKQLLQTSLISSSAENSSPSIVDDFHPVVEQPFRSPELKLSNASMMSLELLRARAAQVPIRPAVSNALPTREPLYEPRSMESAEGNTIDWGERTPPDWAKNLRTASGPTTKETRSPNSVNEVIAGYRRAVEELNSSSSPVVGTLDATVGPTLPQYDGYCNCRCDCIHEVDCALGCIYYAGGMSSPSAQSPSLSLLSGHPKASQSAQPPQPQRARPPPDWAVRYGRRSEDSSARGRNHRARPVSTPATSPPSNRDASARDLHAQLAAVAARNAAIPRLSAEEPPPPHPPSRRMRAAQRSLFSRIVGK